MTDQDGLIFYPSRYEPPLGHAGFEVRLTDFPGDRYFDARRAIFPIEQGGALRRLTVEHPYRLASPFRFAAGRIRLDAHDGDFIEIMSFGGEVSVTVEGDTTVCRAESTAPFLPLAEDVETPLVMLESELEVLIAQSRARWGRDEPLHLDHLSELDPMVLFVASVHTLEGRLSRLARAEGDPTTRATLHLVRQFRERLARAGEWPASPPDLAEII